jgi:hypothetical protein
MLADKIRRCATVTSIKDLLYEADETLEYLKSHNGIVDPPINKGENIVEDAYTVHIDEGADSSLTDATAPDMSGSFTTAIATDTHTVNAFATRHLQQATNIHDTNDSATKRTHNNTVPTGHTVQPSKVQRMSSQGNLSTFTGMSAQGAQVHTSNVEPPMDTSNPFAPLPRDVVGYNIMRDDNSSSDNSSHTNSRWNSRLQARNNGKGKGKGKPFKKGKTRGSNDPYWKVPEFGTALGDARVVFFTMTQLSEPTNIFRLKDFVQLQRSNLPGSVVHAPDPSLVSTRKMPNQPTDPDLCKVYHNALKALFQLSDSPRLYYLHDEDRNARTLLGRTVQYLYGQSVQELVPEDQKLFLGDYWRVLRLRPVTNSYKAQQMQLEYIPNNTYSYYQVKTTLDNVRRVKVKPTRYWNELLVKDVPNDVLYSLSDYHPGLPYEANIIRDNESLGLPLYRIYESTFYQEATPPTADGTAEEDKPRKRVNVEQTIVNLVDLGAIPNQEQETLEGYMTTLEEILARYEKYLQEWPFLVAQRLLKMQVSRLKYIKYALTEKLNNHPLSSANSAVFGSDLNQGNPPAAAGTSSQSGGTVGNNSQSANRSGYSNPSGGRI